MRQLVIVAVSARNPQSGQSHSGAEGEALVLKVDRIL
jgi:hypothetical protein